MTKEKTKISVENGVIQVDKNKSYYHIAECIAGDVAGENRELWYKVCQSVMDVFAANSKTLKGNIMTDINYSLFLNGKSGETIGRDVRDGKTFKEASSYVEGYNDAVNIFKIQFDQLENSIESSLDKFLN